MIETKIICDICNDLISSDVVTLREYSPEAYKLYNNIPEIKLNNNRGLKKNIICCVECFKKVCDVLQIQYAESYPIMR